MTKSHIRHLSSVQVKELLGSVPSNRLERIKVNGVVGNDTIHDTGCKWKVLNKRKIMLGNRW